MMNDAMLRETVRDYQKAPDPDTRKTYYEAIRDALRPPPDMAQDPLTTALEAADPDAPDLLDTLRAAIVPAAAGVTSAADVLTLPEPERVVWCDAPPPDNAAVCSVGEPMVLSAPGGTGKSYLTLHLALRGCGPEAPARACGLTVRPGGVLVVSYEDALARLGARLGALQQRPDVPATDLSQLRIVPDPLPLWEPLENGAGATPTPAFAALAARALADRPSLIVIDPLSAAASGVNVNDGGAARACMRWLIELSTTSGAGVLLVAHDTKAARNEARAGGDPGAGAVAGSGQWFDAARGVVYLHRTADGQRQLECLKANHGRAGWARRLVEVMRGSTFQGFDAHGPVLSGKDVRADRQATNGATWRNDAKDDPGFD